ncbi:MAG: hypothetical protein ACJAXI_002540 [Crocinitomicaceae bacterium]|jgi:hypothetical protein
MKMIRRLKNRLTSLRVRLVKEPSWESVFQTSNEYEIRIKKLLLEDENIPVMIFDQRDSSYNAFGYIYLHVRTIDLEKASKIINTDHEQPDS